MRFKKPFKAVPIKPDPGYLARRKQRARKKRASPKALSHAKASAKARPVKTEKVYRTSHPQQPVSHRPVRTGDRSFRTAILWAVAAGAAIGVGSLAMEPDARAKIRAIAVDLHLFRVRDPQPGDYWSECSEAEAAGTYPIASSEPGYREELDRDRDGIACERYR